MRVDQNTECSAIVEFDDLDSSTTWHHRAYLHNPRKGFDGPAAGFFVQGISPRAHTRTHSNKTIECTLYMRWTKIKNV